MSSFLGTKYYLGLPILIVEGFSTKLNIQSFNQSNKKRLQYMTSAYQKKGNKIKLKERDL